MRQEEIRRILSAAAKPVLAPKDVPTMYRLDTFTGRRDSITKVMHALAAVSAKKHYVGAIAAQLQALSDLRVADALHSIDIAQRELEGWGTF